MDNFSRSTRHRDVVESDGRGRSVGADEPEGKGLWRSPGILNREQVVTRRWEAGGVDFTEQRTAVPNLQLAVPGARNVGKVKLYDIVGGRPDEFLLNRRDVRSSTSKLYLRVRAVANEVHIPVR